MRLEGISREFADVLERKLHFDLRQLAFCTHYSWFGLVKKERLGIEQLYLLYNRNPALLSPNFLTFHIDVPDGGSEWQKKRANKPLWIEEEDGHGFWGRTAFLDSDILCYSAGFHPKSSAQRVKATLLLPASEPRLERRVRMDAKSRRLTIDTRTPRTDARDPDPDHPLTVCVIIPEAFAQVSALADGVEQPEFAESGEITTDGTLVLTFIAEREGFAKDEQTFVVGVGEGPTADRIEERMAHIHGASFDAAASASAGWLDKALDKFTFEGIKKSHRLPYAKAVYQILCNTKTPRGQISRHAAFPSRGSYCCHFLWDSCFVDLGVAQFNERLAEDFLVALCETQEADGKIPHFVCATWNRPDSSQPPLIAWAAWRLYERFRNKEFIRDIYEPLCRSMEWWFTKRDDDGDGLVEYFDGLESGWDNSPRFDKGRIAGVDLNSYLYREMKLMAKMANELARPSEAVQWERRADEFGKLIYARLFDPEDGFFYDRLVAEDRLYKVLTPASFMPLWVDIKLPKGLANDIIMKYLLNPKHFFGARPFPCVAYSDRHYQPEEWWRGPVWPNIAWVMTEVLRMYGFNKERNEAVKRLLQMMTQCDELSELYDSSTGKPLGATALGWTCAVFMELARS